MRADGRSLGKLRSPHQGPARRDGLSEAGRTAASRGFCSTLRRDPNADHQHRFHVMRLYAQCSIWCHLIVTAPRLHAAVRGHRPRRCDNSKGLRRPGNETPSEATSTGICGDPIFAAPESTTERSDGTLLGLRLQRLASKRKGLDPELPIHRRTGSCGQVDAGVDSCAVPLGRNAFTNALGLNFDSACRLRHALLGTSADACGVPRH